MERLQHLINKLKEQFDQKVAPSQMLVTAQLIEAELHSPDRHSSTQRGTTKVAVVMPSARKIAQEEPVAPVLQVAEEQGGRHSGYELYQPKPVFEKTEKEAWSFDPMIEIPTLSHQSNGAKEINDVIGSGGTSLNDKLKEDIVELATSLKGSPVKELKKAIGINDRYVFVKELFRDDEAMYERSIKTINNFRILPEAEYWMERELKVKLGWDDSKETTRHFYQLVRRRFS